MTECLIIGIAGGSGSGKTTLARYLIRDYFPQDAVLIGQDSYYIDQSKKFDRDGGSVNFDHPSALDFALMAKQLFDLKSGHAIEIPIYDFATHQRLAKTEPIKPKSVIIVDGTLILATPLLTPLFSESVFIEVSEELRFQRRLQRDVAERGRTEDGVRAQFFGQVKAMHDLFVEPSKSACTILLKEDLKIQSIKRQSSNHSKLCALIESFIHKRHGHST